MTKDDIMKLINTRMPFCDIEHIEHYARKHITNVDWDSSEAKKAITQAEIEFKEIHDFKDTTVYIDDYHPWTGACDEEEYYEKDLHLFD